MQTDHEEITEVPADVGSAFALITEWCMSVGVYSCGDTYGVSLTGEKWSLQGAAPNGGEPFPRLAGHSYTLHCGGTVLIHGPSSDAASLRRKKARDSSMLSRISTDELRAALAERNET